MTNPGDDAAGTASSEPTGGASEPTSSAYEAPSTEQTQGSQPDQPSYGYQAPPAYDPSSGYPPPPPPPGAYPPPPAYPAPPQGGYPPPPGGYPPPSGSYPPPYSDPANLGQGYPPPPPYGTPSPYGAPGYGTPGYDGGYGLPQDKTNGLAIGALVASAVGVLCGVGSLVGIVLGIVALNQIKASGEGGRGLAIAGIAVGAATLVLNIIFALAMMSS